MILHSLVEMHLVRQQLDWDEHVHQWEQWCFQWQSIDESNEAVQLFVLKTFQKWHGYKC